MSHTCTDGASQLITGHFREYERFRRRGRKKENSKKNEEKRETFPFDIIILAFASAIPVPICLCCCRIFVRLILSLGFKISEPSILYRADIRASLIECSRQINFGIRR